MFSLFLIMSQPFAGTARRPRLAPSVLATSALALTALAGGVILSGGGAKAAFFCNPSGINGPQVLPILNTPAQSTPIVTEGYADASCTSLPSVSLVNDWHTETEITSQTLVPGLARLDTVDIDFNLNSTDGGYMPGLAGGYSGNFFYTITSSTIPYNKVSLDGNQLSGAGVTMTKKIFYSQPADPDTTIADVTLPWSGTAVSTDLNPTSTQIWVYDTYNIPTSNPSLDNLINSYQTPGPLPILGAGTAFGFTRKLRRRIKTSRQA